MKWLPLSLCLLLTSCVSFQKGETKYDLTPPATGVILAPGSSKDAKGVGLDESCIVWIHEGSSLVAKLPPSPFSASTLQFILTVETVTESGLVTQGDKWPVGTTLFLLSEQFGVRPQLLVSSVDVGKRQVQFTRYQNAEISCPN